MGEAAAGTTMRGLRLRRLLLLLLAWAVLSWAARLHIGLTSNRPVARPIAVKRRNATALVRAACTHPPRTRGEILSWFADFLEEHRIDYVLFKGTLLGALRGRKIIPWTCDVDILLPRLFVPRSNTKSHARMLLEELICDDDGGAAPERCVGFCVFGKVNAKVFHVRFDPNTIEACPGESGGSVYLDVYGMMKRGRFKTTGIEWPEKSEEEARTNPSHYLFGSKFGGVPHGVFLDYAEIYPINKTGSLIDGRRYPSLRKPKVLIRKVYGTHWRNPDPNFHPNWCRWGWCLTSFGLERIGDAGGTT